MDSSKSEALTSWMDSWTACGAHPGVAVGIWKGGKNIFRHNSNHHGSNEISNNTIYRIYSMTKPITIVGIMMLVDKGLLAVDDPVSKFIPEFASATVFREGTVEAPIVEPLARPITIKDLMMHRTGITYGIFGNSVCDQLLRQNCPDAENWFRNTPLKELCAAVAKTPMLFQPGAKWHYGLNTDVLGHVIELVSQQTLDVYFRENIFEPLGMSDTAFVVNDGNKARLAPVYQVAPGQSFIDVSAQPEKNRVDMAAMLSGGGGLVSSMDDYAKFGTMLLNKGAYTRIRIADSSAGELVLGGSAQLLRSELVEEMSANHLENNGELIDHAFDASFSESIGAGVGFGYGVSVIVRPEVARGAKYSSKGEFGWGGVASTFFSVNPAQKMFCIMMTQLIPSTHYPIRTQFRYLAYWAAQEREEDKK
jgi:CubicO group peptidase (beta-lactamase class C family)